MKAHFKITCVILGISLLLAGLFSSGNAGLFFGFFGAINCVVGFICLLLALICNIAGNDVTGKALALAGGLCLLIGTGACTITLNSGLKL